MLSIVCKAALFGILSKILRKYYMIYRNRNIKGHAKNITLLNVMAKHKTSKKTIQFKKFFAYWLFLRGPIFTTTVGWSIFCLLIFLLLLAL